MGAQADSYNLRESRTQGTHNYRTLLLAVANRLVLVLFVKQQ